MKKIALSLLGIMLLASCSNTSNTTSGLKPSDHNLAVIETVKGVIKMELKEKEAPITVANFKKLVNQKFYDGLTFHRVEKDFLIQGGDPNGNGSGGSEEKIPLEVYCTDGSKVVGSIAPKTCEPVLKHSIGAIGMARQPDPNTASSQFYILIQPQPPLEGGYAIFASVTEGMEVVKKIEKDDKIISIRLE